MSNTFGQFIAIEREKSQLTQKELAAKVGISAQYLNDIERGRRGPPPDYLIEVFINALKADNPDVFYYYAGRFPPDVRNLSPDVAIRAVKAFREQLVNSI